MIHLNFRAPNIIAHDRSDLNAMVSDWISRHGPPRKFERGFSNDWSFLQEKMREYGWELSMVGGFYTLRKTGQSGRPKRMRREEVIEAIDEILIAHGKQPFILRSAA